MSDALLQALIIGGGAFVGSVLGNVVRPVLDHYLRGRTQRAKKASTTARAQFEEIYKPLYNMFQDGLPPDVPFEHAVTPEMRDRIVELVNKNRDLADPALEHSVLVIEETAYLSAGGVDTEELLDVWNHVDRKYNGLRQRLGLPYTPWWRARSRPLYQRIRRWWRNLTLVRRLRRMRARKIDEE